MLAATALVVAISLPLCGCNVIHKLRHVFHPNEAQQIAELGNAGLRVDVEPPDGIAISLDGVHVASVSPYVGKHLKAGAHTLEVRAMGYFTVDLPVELHDGRTLEVPVSLRPRPQPQQSPTPPPRRARPHKHPPPPPQPPAPSLPAGVDAVRLQLVPRPDVPVSLDGLPVGRHLQLDRVYGMLRIGKVQLAYHVVGAGVLRLTLPMSPGTWRKDTLPVAAGSSFDLNRGIVRLEHSGPTGQQVILIRRD